MYVKRSGSGLNRHVSMAHRASYIALGKLVKRTTRPCMQNQQLLRRIFPLKTRQYYIQTNKEAKKKYSIAAEDRSLLKLCQIY